MKKQEEPDTLLVVVRSESQARAIETALSVREIAVRVRRDATQVIEFGNQLGLRPFALYVLGEDLTRARDVLAAEGLPNGDAAPDVRSAFEM